MNNTEIRSSVAVTQPAPQGLAGIASSVGEIEFTEIFRAFKRRKYLLLGTVLLMTGLAIFAVTRLVPLYTATTLVLIEEKGQTTLKLDAVVAGLTGDSETIQNQIEIIRSRGLAEKVITRLGLDQNPEFNAKLRPPGFVAKLKDVKSYLPEPIYDVVGPTLESFFAKDKEEAEAEANITAEDKADVARIKIINRFLKKLDLSRKGESFVIQIDFTSENPATAARVANTIADLYIVEQLEAKFEATQRATLWLNDRVSSLRSQVEASERAVEVFREQSGLLQAKGVSLTAQQISELNSQLILARTARAEAEARLQQIQGLLGSGDGINIAAEVLDSPTIQNLRQQEAEVERKVAELSAEYGARHPKMRNALAEKEEVRQKLKAELQKAVKQLEYTVGVAKARQSTLTASLNRLKSQVAESNTAEVQLRALEREANANRQLLETFLGSFKELSAQEDFEIQQPDARIISRADVPTKPSYPNKLLMVVMAFVGSLMVGLVLVLVIEQLDYGFRSGDEIERVTGVPVLGLVPRISGLKNLGNSPEEYILKRPASAFGEAIRSLNTSILLSHVDEPPKRILVTSSEPNEGKSTISVCLARTLARSGKKIVVIDADLRRPSIHSMLDLEARPGLVELLAGSAALEDAIQLDEPTGAHVITAGQSVSNPADILSSRQMIQLLDALGESYDLVIVDSPPIMAVSDARVLAKYVDGTVFVARWLRTRRETVKMGLRQISTAGGRIAGVLLTLVDAKKHAQYNYADSGYFSGKSAKYYTN